MEKYTNKTHIDLTAFFKMWAAAFSIGATSLQRQRRNWSMRLRVGWRTNTRTPLVKRLLVGTYVGQYLDQRNEWGECYRRLHTTAARWSDALVREVPVGKHWHQTGSGNGNVNKDLLDVNDLLKIFVLFYLLLELKMFHGYRSLWLLRALIEYRSYF